MRTVIIGILLSALAVTAYAAPNIEMVYVKGGCYQMGDAFGDGRPDETPVHQVCVDDFNMGKYEVTQAQWQAVMGSNPSFFKECGGDCPVEQVSWEEAQEFIRQLNGKTGKNYRLPTEAEWEYAARSGGKREKWAGTSDPDELGAYAWFGVNSDQKTHQAGTRRPNGLGLYDMTGNVWEWCKDWHDAEYYKKSPEKNPSGALSGVSRIVRGGCSNNAATVVRAARRNDITPSYSDELIGFRLVLPAVK